MPSRPSGETRIAAMQNEQSEVERLLHLAQKVEARGADAKAEALLCMRYWDDGIDDDFDPTSWARGSLRPPVVGGKLELQNVRALISRFQKNGALK